MNREAARTEARRRRSERARIAQMSDAQLAVYLSRAVRTGALVEFRMALHEVRVARGAAGIYRRVTERESTWARPGRGHKPKKSLV